MVLNKSREREYVLYCNSKPYTLSFIDDFLHKYVTCIS